MSTPLLDTSDPDLRRVDARLANETLGWFGTTRPDGRPHHVPVWFCWQDPAIVVFTQRRSQKVTNARVNDNAMFTLESADGGNDVVIVEGRVSIVSDREIDTMVTAFERKYRRLLTGTFHEWRANFDQALLFAVERVLAWSKPGGELRFREITSR